MDLHPTSVINIKFSHVLSVGNVLNDAEESVDRYNSRTSVFRASTTRLRHLTGNFLTSHSLEMISTHFSRAIFLPFFASRSSEILENGIVCFRRATTNVSCEGDWRSQFAENSHLALSREEWTPNFRRPLSRFQFRYRQRNPKPKAIYNKKKNSPDNDTPTGDFLHFADEMGTDRIGAGKTVIKKIHKLIRSIYACIYKETRFEIHNLRHYLIIEFSPVASFIDSKIVLLHLHSHSMFTTEIGNIQYYRRIVYKSSILITFEHF